MIIKIKNRKLSSHELVMFIRLMNLPPNLITQIDSLEN